jgi:tetratricopeptide (TPR) repeat protein
LFEVDVAFQIVPHAPTLYLVSGIIYAKMHRVDEANHAFQRAVQQCALLRDTVECIVAMLLQARGHCDHAIGKTTEVLKRNPFFVAALLARGEAYRHHASGYFHKQADADFNKLLQQDARLQALVEHRFTLENHALIDERLLWLHPWLSTQGPKPYHEYEIYRRHRITKGQPIFLASLIC